MSKMVNIILHGGKVVSVPEELAKEALAGGTSRLESPDEATSRELSGLNTARSAGAGEGVIAAIEGFADAASLGGIGALLGAGDEEYARNRAIRTQERSGARLTGELAALLLPTGAFGSTAKAAGKVLPSAIAGNAAAGAGGLLAEGAVYGAGAAISNANISTDPLSIESVVADAGIGAILNLGFGKIAQSIGLAGQKATEKIAIREAAEKNLNFLNSKPESYDNLYTTFANSKDAIKQSQKAFDRSNVHYENDLRKFLDFQGATEKAIVSIDSLERTALDQLMRGVYGSGKTGRAIINYPPGSPIKTNMPLSKEDKLLLHAIRDSFQDARLAASKAVSAGDELGAINIISKAVNDVEELAKTIRAGSTNPNGVIDINLEKLLNIPRLPKLPNGSRPIDFLENLPKSMEEFARAKPAVIKTLANNIDEASELAKSVKAFASDIGVVVDGTASKALIDAHNTLSTIAQVSGKETGRAGKRGLLDILREHSKLAIKYGAGRAADTGGFGGAAARTMVGAATGYALNGVEGAIIGASVLNARAASKDRMNNLFANYGQKTSTAIKPLGSAVTYLGVSFITGEKDNATDLREQALNRINELNALRGSLNDASFSAVQPLADVPNDMAFKLHSQIVNTVNLLLGSTPKDPGLATNMFQSYWKPTNAQAIKLAHQIEAATAPMDAIRRLMNGDGDLETANALWQMWPAHLQEAAIALANNVEFMGNLTREQGTYLSRIFRVPLNGFSQPENIATLQSLFLPQTPTAPSTPPSKRPTGGPNGRPPAVTSSNPNQSRVSQLQVN